MDDHTRHALEDVSEGLAAIARRVGELTLAHERLAARPGEGTPGDPPDSGGRGAGGDAVRRDRVSYMETARSALYRLLFVVDLSLVHEQVDPVLLRDARATLVDGVDALDACLMLEEAGPGR